MELHKETDTCVERVYSESDIKRYIEFARYDLYIILIVLLSIVDLDFKLPA